MSNQPSNPAEVAAAKANARVFACLDTGRPFLVEAGAGAGKTESLVLALNHIITTQGQMLRRRHQQVACITYTNVATAEIRSRTDRHPVVNASTIHAFCWSLVRDFQKNLCEAVHEIGGLQDQIAESGIARVRRVSYDLGHRRVNADSECVSLGHNDVLTLTSGLLREKKFRSLVAARYPILLIDEYQDTNTEFAAALTSHCLVEARPLIGLFGDHWQKIYGDGCGKIQHSTLEVIGKKANFRSAPAIVAMLNRMRTQLPQEACEPGAGGSAVAYHTNAATVSRRNDGVWKGDLPPETAHAYLEELKVCLTSEEWDFSSTRTKILMLTHSVLAQEQGYSGIAAAFKGHNEGFARKEDEYIEFCVETLEPICRAFEGKRYGDMFAAIGVKQPAIRNHADKVKWSKDMETLLALRETGTIGSVLEEVKRADRIRIPESVVRRERELARESDGNDESLRS